MLELDLDLVRVVPSARVTVANRILLVQPVIQKFARIAVRTGNKVDEIIGIDLNTIKLLEKNQTTYRLFFSRLFPRLLFVEVGKAGRFRKSSLPPFDVGFIFI